MAEKDPPVTAGNQSDDDKEVQSPDVVCDGQETEEKAHQDSTFPAAASDTENSATNVEQDDDKTSEKAVSDGDCKKLVSNEDNEKPITDKDSKKPASDEVCNKPVSTKDDGKTVTIKDCEISESYEDSGEPVSREDEGKPVAVKDCEKSESDKDTGKQIGSEDDGKAVIDKESKKPVSNEDCNKPVSTKDDGKTVTIKDCEKSESDEDRGEPVSSEDDVKPVTMKDCEKSKSDEDRGEPVSREDDGKPVIVKDIKKSGSEEDNRKPVSGEDGKGLLTDEYTKKVVTIGVTEQPVSVEDSEPAVTGFAASLKYDDRGQDGQKRESKKTIKTDVETFVSLSAGDGNSELSSRGRQMDEKSSGEVKVATITSLTTSADEHDQTDRSGTILGVSPMGDDGDGTNWHYGLRQSTATTTAEMISGDEHKDHKKDQEKKEGFGLGKAAIISVIIVAITASVVHFYSKSQPPVQENTQRIDLFLKQLKQVKGHFPSQRAELWNRGTIHLQRHLQTVQPTEPVSVILTAGRSAKRTLRCLAGDLASAYAVNASVLHIDGASKASQESDQVKFDIDSQLQQAFEGGKPVAVIHQFEELPPGSTLIFYRYCDHENAAYKKTFLIFTVLLGDEEDIPPKIPLSSVEEMVDDHLQKKFLSGDHPVAFDTMDLDKYGGLWSRISHLILPVAAERSIEDEGCKWK